MIIFAVFQIMLGPESTLNPRIPSHAQAYVCVNVCMHFVSTCFTLYIKLLRYIKPHIISSYSLYEFRFITHLPFFVFLSPYISIIVFGIIFLFSAELLSLFYNAVC